MSSGLRLTVQSQGFGTATRGSIALQALSEKLDERMLTEAFRLGEGSSHARKVPDERLAMDRQLTSVDTRLQN